MAKLSLVARYQDRSGQVVLKDNRLIIFVFTSLFRRSYLASRYDDFDEDP